MKSSNKNSGKTRNSTSKIIDSGAAYYIAATVPGGLATLVQCARAELAANNALKTNHNNLTSKMDSLLDSQVPTQPRESHQNLESLADNTQQDAGTGASQSTLNSTPNIA